MKVSSLVKLLRVKPLIAWSFSSIIVSAVLLVSEYGTVPSAFFFLGMLVVVVLQGILSHILNDYADFEVDSQTDIFGTCRSDKLLVTGEATLTDFKYIGSIASGMLALVAVISWVYYGWFPVFLILSGCWFVVNYSVGLKLGYKPLSEVAVVLPVIICAVVGLYYVGSNGHLNYNVFEAGVALGLFNMSTFTISRLVDVDVDRSVNKITSPVLLYGRFPRLKGLFTLISMFYFWLGIHILFGGFIEFLLALMVLLVFFSAFGGEVLNDAGLLGRVRRDSMYFVAFVIILWSVVQLG